MILYEALGKGSYGVVRRALNKETMEYCAVKIMKRGNVSMMSQMDREVQAMKLLDHKNVVKLYDVFERGQDIFLVMELCGGGSLFEFLESKPLAPDVARYYYRQLVDGIDYCHSKVGPIAPFHHERQTF